MDTSYKTQPTRYPKSRQFSSYKNIQTQHVQTLQTLQQLTAAPKKWKMPHLAMLEIVIQQTKVISFKLGFDLMELIFRSFKAHNLIMNFTSLNKTFSWALYHKRIGWPKSNAYIKPLCQLLSPFPLTYVHTTVPQKIRSHILFTLQTTRKGNQIPQLHIIHA